MSIIGRMIYLYYLYDDVCIINRMIYLYHMEVDMSVSFVEYVYHL